MQIIADDGLIKDPASPDARITNSQVGKSEKNSTAAYLNSVSTTTKEHLSANSSLTTSSPESFDNVATSRERSWFPDPKLRI